MPRITTRPARRFDLIVSPRRRAQSSGATAAWFAWILLLLTAAGGTGFYLWSERTAVPSTESQATATTAAQRAAAAEASVSNLPAGTIGWVDTPDAEAVIGPVISITGWALDAKGLRGVEVRIGERAFAARVGVARADIAEAKPGFPDSQRAGFEFTGDLSTYPAPIGTDRRDVKIVAIAADGSETVLGTRSLIDRSAQIRWREEDRHTRKSTPFYLLPALSGISTGGVGTLDTRYSPYLSGTARVGMRVPILYLRATRGKAGDYAFDPDWDVTRRCGERVIAEDSLRRTIDEAVKRKLPVLFTLNGGIWADAACDVPDWDLNDMLEQDKANCQWNERNEVVPDDFLKTLPGSQNAPELARSLTFNIYARDVRHYKRRNLQAAGRVIAEFARAHPDLFVGANLDPDSYLNPFFGEQHWFDYNPGTLRQFRHWLAGTGPYAGRTEPGVPDLKRYRRARPLNLAQVNALSGQRFKQWDEVEPPRSFPREAKDGHPEYWKDRWGHEWETFRRHLVDLHYDEMSQWLNEAGIPSERIWSAQGFMAPDAKADPFAIHIDGPMKNYDTGGSSIEGAIPKAGHLGVIVYGPAAVNDVRMEEPRSLFATFSALDGGWAIVEYNTADLRAMKTQPDYAAAYRGLRDAFNFGARFVSPMAWNGSDGKSADKPDYVTFTAWRNTPLEDAARDFLLSHANVPLGAKLWTFGTGRFASADGWTAERGNFAPDKGFVRLAPVDNEVALVSPPELLLAPRSIDHLVLGLVDAADVVSVRVLGRASEDIAGSARSQASKRIASSNRIADVEVISRSNPSGAPERSPWREMAVVARPAALRVTPAGLTVPLSWPPGVRSIDQVRVELRFASDAPQTLARVALWPSATPAR